MTLNADGLCLPVGIFIGRARMRLLYAMLIIVFGSLNADAGRITLPTSTKLPTVARSLPETTGSDRVVPSEVCAVQYIKREDGWITKVRRCDADYN
jgi:hypothetical protein